LRSFEARFGCRPTCLGYTRIGVDPEIEAWSGSEFWRRITYSERFRLLHVFVAAEIATYEYDCTGTSRKADLLTDGYKKECDARRTALQRYPRRALAPVVWTEPREARRSTKRRFDGTDFPRRVPARQAITSLAGSTFTVASVRGDRRGDGPSVSGGADSPLTGC
jgi:hypothetical protein